MGSSSSMSISLGLLCLFLGLLLNVIALATAHWMHVPGLQIGLMRHCNVIENSCVDNFGASLDVYNTNENVSFFRFVQVAFMLATLGTVCCLCFAIVLIVKFIELEYTYKYMSVLNTLVFASELIAVVLFGVKADTFLDGVTTELSWSYHCAVAGCVFVFLSAVFHLAEATKAGQAMQKIHHRITVWSTPYTLFSDQEV